MLLTTALAGVLLSAPAEAQDRPQTRPAQTPAQTQAQRPAGENEAVDLGTIDVTAARPRGSADTDIPPDVTLDAEQIQSYGASSIAELLTYLEPLTRSSSGRGGGQPVFLVNGRRISGFREIAGLPPEAIERTEILPEEVALRYGYSADQRVVNFVLKQDFRSVNTELTAGGPTAGGRSNVEVEGGLVTIDRANRWNVDVELQRQTALNETERDIVRLPPDTSVGRTLLPDTRRAQVRGAYKRDLDQNTQGTVSFSLEDTNSQSFLGLAGPTQTGPARERTSDALNAQLGVLLDGYWGDDWRWNTNVNYSRVEIDTSTDQGLGGAPDTASSVSQSLGAELVLNGDVYELPAGDVSTTFRFGADQVSLDSTSIRPNSPNPVIEREQSRETASASGNFNIPIARRDREVLAGLGDLSLNANVGWRELSDFGGLRSLGLSANWSPVEPLSIIASWTNEQGPPSIGQLNDPILDTPGVPVFDYQRNQTVAVTQRTGGNPSLDADDRDVWKLGFTLRSFEEQDFSFQSTWTREVVEDAIVSFPTITATLESALPGRFTRDGAGRLVAIDTRPLNFDRTERQDIRTGINFSRAFGTPRAPAPGEGQGAGRGPRGGAPMVIMGGPPPGGGGQAGPGGGGGPQFRMGGGGRGRGPMMQPGQGRFTASLYHTWRLQDEVTIAPGLPSFDQLEGETVSGRTGQARHEVQGQFGVFKDGFGAFTQASWTAATRVEGGTGPDLRFSPRTVVNLNLFANLDQRTKLIEQYPWLKGTRVSLQVRNLFDEDIRVSSSAGPLTAVNYQSDFLDPTGRLVQVQIRKILF